MNELHEGLKTERALNELQNSPRFLQSPSERRIILAKGEEKGEEAMDGIADTALNSYRKTSRCHQMERNTLKIEKREKKKKRTTKRWMDSMKDYREKNL